jgi:hypothetical protein
MLPFLRHKNPSRWNHRTNHVNLLRSLYLAFRQTVEIIVFNGISRGFDVILATMRAKILLNPGGFPASRTLGEESISIIHHLNHLLQGKSLAVLIR